MAYGDEKMPPENFKLILEKSVSSTRFNGNILLNDILNSFNKNSFLSNELGIIAKNLGEDVYKYTISGLLRNSFLIELVNDDISTTIMEVRWVVKESGGKKHEEFKSSDPRYSSFDECYNIFTKLIYELLNVVEKNEVKNLLKLYRKYKLIPYELPIDYIDYSISVRPIPPIHVEGNIEWNWGGKFAKLMKLREFLMSSEFNDMHNTFKEILTNKIKVKTYLTDRVQTGSHKTDREKRWEVHPESVHFATRKCCIQIECTLINQLCHFADFPKEIFEKLIKNSLITNAGEVFRCPITLEPMSFQKLKDEIEKPVHGKSDFQIGHLNPLKRSIDDPISGHTPKNISWVSSEGNRIQGDLSLEETRKLLKRIQDNYSKYI